MWHVQQRHRCDDEEEVIMKFRAVVIWTQWYVGLWWWPVYKDRAFGVNLGPLHLQWTRSEP